MNTQTSITNFRDIGGYQTEDGRRVKQGALYRSAVIQFKTDEDRKAFESLGIKTILDLRSDGERRKAEDDVPENCRYIQCSAVSADNEYEGNVDMADLMKSGNLQSLASYMEDVYRELPFRNEAVGKVFELMRNGGTPLVFHCSAGKDRTGFVAYVILKMLGVSDETAMEDYLLSNDFRREENEQLLALAEDAEIAKSMLYVKPEYLQSSIEAIANTYGNFKTYLKEEYGIEDEDIREFKDRYLE